ncbi:MAG: Crossover junction endodeoxyribonuclease RuvC [Dehalococcoidia bacterium]|nr:Crossover junction endodeoxyribonuclease RuvC [Bacillota bacterium]MBT9141825.1 Crossover junction endodeoxyribonuclease RuvC [Bacillota bacterium]
MRIIGVDPGIATTGYGFVESDGNRSIMLAFGCVITAPDLATPARLELVYRGLTEVVEKFRPDVMVVEKLFFAKNCKSVMQVGEARGVALLVGQLAMLSVFEYTPLQIKQAVVGYGRAEKSQVQQMVKVLLGLPTIPRPDDAADALAVALCHAHTGSNSAAISRRGNYV